MAANLDITRSADSDHGAPLGFADVVTAAKAVADPLRANVLRVLKEESYGVLELCGILDSAQPALSHHLKVLHRAGLVVRRREGNSIFYRRAPAPTTFHLALLTAIDEVTLAEPQSERISAVHRERRRRSEAFFAERAVDFAGNQARISEARVYAGSVLDAIDRLGLGDGTALEIGPGDGELLEPLARRFHEVVGIDSARSMLDRCAERVQGLANVRLMHRNFAELAPRPRFQLVLAAMVAHHQPSPQQFFRHAGKLLRRDGVLVVVELCHHDHEWARTACGDLWLGFEPGELGEWAAIAGLDRGESQFLAQKNGFRIQIHTYHNRPR
jgi:ArsR family transcriptional regulator